MLKNLSRLECMVNNKVGHFYCDYDTPLEVAKEMLFQFQKYIGQVEDAHKAAKEQHEEKVAQESNSKVEPIVEPKDEMLEA